MTILTHTTDEKARITLPKNFANSTVLVEQVSDTELRIRKARVIPEDELPFVEEAMAPLSDRDRDVFLALLDNPPPPNDALRGLLKGGPSRIGVIPIASSRAPLDCRQPGEQVGRPGPGPSPHRRDQGPLKCGPPARRDGYPTRGDFR